MTRSIHRLRTCAVTLMIAFAVGCDRSPTEPEDALEVREIILAGDDGSYAFTHHDHWHGAPVVRAGAQAGFTVHLASRSMATDDHEPVPAEEWFTLEGHPDYSLRVVVEDTTIARWAGDRARGTLQGLREGASRISIIVRRGSTTIFEAPPLNVRVQAPAD